MGDVDEQDGIVAPTNHISVLGVLNGVNLETSEHYTTRLDTTAAGLAFYREPGRAWVAAIEDAEREGVAVMDYLKNIDRNIKMFCASGDVPNRPRLKRKLRQRMRMGGIEKGRSIEKKVKLGGSITLLLGGRRMGKTTMLNEICEFHQSEEEHQQQVDNSLGICDAQPPSNAWLQPIVLKIKAESCRENAAKALFGALEDLKENFIKKNYVQWIGHTLNSALKKVIGIVRHISSISVPGVVTLSCGDGFSQEVGEMCSLGFDSTTPTVMVIEEFIRFADSQQRHPVLIVDGVNDAFDKDTDIVRDIVTEVIRATKQTTGISSVIAMSQCHSVHPWEGPDLNVPAIRVVLKDRSPKDMYNLLVNDSHPLSGKKTVGMGTNLAEICIGAYGSDFLLIEDAVVGLQDQANAFRANGFTAPLAIRYEITDHLADGELRRLLENMVVRGYVSVNDCRSDVVQRIVKQNYGCVVMEKDFTEERLPHHFWGTSNIVLIPSCQAMRLYIAESLTMNPA